jgi:hypothetical protein
MMGQQEVHLLIRYVLAVWDFDEVHLSFIVFDMKLECACALDVYPSFYPFHLCLILDTVDLEVLELVWAVSQRDRGVGVNANDKGAGVKADSWDLIW